LLRKYRERADLTQEELGAIVGRNHSYISLMESGKRSPSFEVMERLVGELCNSEEEVVFFYQEAGLPHTTPLAQELAKEPELLAMTQLLAGNELPFLQRKMILDTLRALRDATRAAFPEV
jgi:transcriptional regulator with XRE-family HTH domain